MKKHIGLLTLLTIVTGPIFASQYAVQLEASKAPQLGRYKQLGIHGELYTVATDNGYIRARLGPFDEKQAALDVLAQVHDAGFTQAFVAKEKNRDRSAASTSAPNINAISNIENIDVKTLPEWQLLTAEQQANVVYLDGALHVKNGNEFTPLAEITNR